jgi:hypothetical protein
MVETRHSKTIRVNNRVAASVTRDCLRDKKLVYIIQADRRLKYPNGRSRIAYIGTTRKGMSRVLSSLAYRAKKILRVRGVRECHVRLVACAERDGLDTWRILERELLVGFRKLFGTVPRFNTQGKGIKRPDYFTPSRVRRVIEDLS